MQEHLKRIRIPVADGSTHELVIPEETDYGRMEAYAREQAATVRADLSARIDDWASRTASLEEVVMAFISGGRDAGAEAALLATVASPAGDYTTRLEQLEEASPGVLKRLLKAEKVSPEEIASHFPQVTAIVEPDDALFRFPAGAYLPAGEEVAAVNGLFCREARYGYNGSRNCANLVTVEEVLYWNFSRHIYLRSGSARKLSGLVNLSSCEQFCVDPYVAVSVDFPVVGVSDRWTGTLEGGFPVYPLKASFDARSYSSTYFGKTEQTLRHLPPRIDTSRCCVDRMFYGLNDVMSYPDIDLSGSVGRDLFTALEDAPPKRYVRGDGSTVDRRALVTNLGKYRVWPPENRWLDKRYHTDFTGLVDWSYSDIYRTLKGALPVDVEWKLYLNRQTYDRMQILGVSLADLTSKGYTVVCVDVPMETPEELPSEY